MALDLAVLNKIEGTLLIVNESLTNMRERMARLEAQTVNAGVSELRQENARLWEAIGRLEAERNVRTGQVQATKTWAEWSHRLGPWILAIAVVVWTYVRPPG